MMGFRSGLFSMMLAAAVAGGCGDDPVIPLPSSFTAIEAGILHTCGIIEDGAAYCWGYNETGQLGDGSHSTRTTPRPVLGNLRFTSLSGGGGHTCGLTSDERTYCWGLNLNGQLGDGSSADRATPATTMGSVTLASISAGAAYTCGLTSGGQAHCWGWNRFGQLGDGSTTDRLTPTAVSGGRTFTSVAAGAFHSCGLTGAGEVYCWGQNEAGQLGNGGLESSSIPVKVSSSAVFMAVDVGFRHACALGTDGKAYCWGANDFGQLGLGEDASGGNQQTPAAVVGDLRFSSLSIGAGAAFTCAIEQGTGTVYCWGFNGSGQLGDVSTTQCVDAGGNRFPCMLSPKAVRGGLSFASMSADTQHVCGLTTDGVAYCWGLGSQGQLGDGGKGDTYFTIDPVRVLGQP